MSRVLRGADAAGSLQVVEVLSEGELLFRHATLLAACFGLALGSTARPAAELTPDVQGSPGGVTLVCLSPAA